MTTRAILAAGAALMIAAATQPAAAQQMDAAATSQSVNNTQVLVGGGAGGGTIDYQGGYTVKNVPDAIAPMLPGGTNPCVVAASAAGSIVGFGMSAGHSWNSEECERRNLSVILMNAAAQFGQPELASAAIEVLCQHDDVALAMDAVGRPCLTRRGSPQKVLRAGKQTASAGGEWDWIAEAGR